MKKLINIALVALVGIFAVGCYNDQGIPEIAHVYTDADFDDCEIISIREFKDYYSSHVGNSTNEVITSNWVIRGKVISSDESGNIYKSLYIQDDDAEHGRAAIELRLFASNYTKYPEGYTVYVKLKDLSIGDYSGMISVGAHSYSATDPDYVHTTIEGRVMLDEHIFLGEEGSVTESDTLVINADNYLTFDYDSYLACLIRFEGLESAIATSKFGYKNSYPNYFSDSSNNFSWDSSLGETDDFWVNPPMAYKGKNPFDSSSSSSTYYYGSAWYTYDRNGTTYPGQFVVRLSAYARFKDREIPADGTTVEITAILTQFGSTYQIVPRYESDIVEM